MVDNFQKFHSLLNEPQKGLKCIDEIFTKESLEKYNGRIKEIKLISIEGCIGAGKSTLLEKIQLLGLSGIEVIKEPSDRWENEKACGSEKSMLQSYYSDQKDNGGAFQMYALVTRLIRLVNTVNTTTKKIIIMERSPYSDMNCFFRINVENGYINSTFTTVYNLYFKLFEILIQFKPSAYIYLDLRADDCSSRIKERARDAEKTIDDEYLRMLEVAHLEWIRTEKNVLCIDASQNFRDDETVMGKILADIMMHALGFQ
jgi:deoxyadenosine/deoxycytidine kinase